MSALVPRGLGVSLISTALYVCVPEATRADLQTAVIYVSLSLFRSLFSRCRQRVRQHSSVALRAVVSGNGGVGY